VGRFHALYRLFGLGRRGHGGGGISANKKFVQGFCPAGMNYYVDVVFTYDEGKRCYWRLGGLSILPLDAPWQSATSGWNTTTDGSNLTDYEVGAGSPGGTSRQTIKMALDGTIDLTTIPAGNPTLTLNMPSAILQERVGQVFQIRFRDPVPGLSFSGSSAGACGLTNEDGGVGRLWRFTIPSVAPNWQMDIPVNSTAVPGMTIKRPAIVPHPTLNSAAVSPEPVGLPSEVARLGKAGVVLRMLDPGRYNSRIINGDSMNALRLRTVEPTDYLFGTDTGQPCISFAEQVTFCNEAGCGMHAVFSHRDHPSLIATQINELKRLVHPLCYVEFSNEVWNTQFPQAAECAVMGIRAGLGVTATTASAVASANYMWPNKHTNTVTNMAHSTGDLVLYNVNGQGVALWQILANVPINTPLPAIHSKSIFWAQGSVAFDSVDSFLYYAIQDVPGTTSNQIDRTNTTYWRVLSSTDPADIAICPFAQLIPALAGRWAAYRFRSQRTALIEDLATTARLSVGQPKVLAVINIQNGTTVRGAAAAASSTEGGLILEFDDNWRRAWEVMHSVYVGITGLTSSQTVWNYTVAGASTWLAADKQLVYRTDVTPRQAVDDAANKILSDTNRAFYVSSIQTVMQSFLYNQSLSLQAFIEGLRVAWNAANPGNQYPVQSPRLGFYEFGFQSQTSSSGWPDEASAWSISKAYTSGYLQANFAKVGSRLFRCLADHTGQDPSATTGYWEEILPVNPDIDGKSHQRIGALLNAVWAHPNMYKLQQELYAMIKSFADANQNGEFHLNGYTSVRQYADGAVFAFGFRFGVDETKAVSPAWFAAAENKTYWDALA